MRKLTVRLANLDRTRGAAAVEFAIVLTVLLMIVFGIIDFGRAYNAKVTLAQAAREGARLVALNQGNVVSRTQDAATGLNPVSVNVVQSCPAGATQGSDAKVTVTYQYSFVTPLLALMGVATGPVTLTGVGEMPCAG
jgi:Flp pilus assembly protein TadG